MPTLTPDQIEDAARAMPDHTLATSFLEPDARARVMALILFAYEIARARAVVSEAGLAAIRLQWWRDTVDQIYSGKVVRAQPTAIALAGAIKEANLPRNLLDAMIDGHAQELETIPFATWADVETYLDATFGNLNRMSLLASGLPAITRGAEEVARQAGIAWGLAHLLRTTPLWASRRCLWLPTEVCGGLDFESIFAGNVSTALQQLMRAAQNRISGARKHANHALQSANLGSHFPVLAPATLAKRLATQAIPKAGPSWQIRSEVTLLERQIRITAAVALGRI
jgi:phytoene/squalene synthetase